MRIVYTIGLLIGIPLAFMIYFVLAVKFEDFMQARFGKPPQWVIVLGLVGFAYIVIKIAWDQAGQWIK